MSMLSAMEYRDWLMVAGAVLLRALAASGENSAAIAVRLNRTAAGVRMRAMDLGVRLAGSKREPGLKAKK
jgi:hypothetical protein